MSAQLAQDLVVEGAQEHSIINQRAVSSNPKELDRQDWALCHVAREIL